MPRVGYRFGELNVRLTPRRRALPRRLVSCPLGYAYVLVAGHLVTALARASRPPGALQPRHAAVTRRVQRLRPGAPAPRAVPRRLVGLELLVLTAAVLAVAYGLARWVDLAAAADGRRPQPFGPTSLGLRLRAAGPRDETRRLADEIDAMLDRLAEGYEAQRRFAANASHELRTPLATQRALIEVSLSRRSRRSSSSCCPANCWRPTSATSGSSTGC